MKRYNRFKYDLWVVASRRDKNVEFLCDLRDYYVLVGWVTSCDRPRLLIQADFVWENLSCIGPLCSDIACGPRDGEEAVGNYWWLDVLNSAGINSVDATAKRVVCTRSWNQAKCDGFAQYRCLIRQIKGVYLGSVTVGFVNVELQRVEFKKVATIYSDYGTVKMNRFWVVLRNWPEGPLLCWIVCRSLHKDKPLDLIRAGKHDLDLSNLSHNIASHARRRGRVVVYCFSWELNPTGPS